MVVDVGPALQEYERRLRDLGAAVVGHLQPGLTDDEIGDLEAEYDITLPPDARAVWRWRDLPTPSGTTGPYELTPGMRFLGLREALDLSRTMVRIYNPIVEGDGADHLRWEPTWVPLTTDGKLFIVLDATYPRAESARTMLFFAAGDISAFIQMPLIHRVQWWLWALDHQAWTVNPDGSWRRHRDRDPSGPGLDSVLI